MQKKQQLRSTRGMVARRTMPASGWRATVASFGGFVTIGLLTAAVAIFVLVVVMSVRQSRNTTAASTKPLMGEAIPASDTATDRLHVTDPSLMRIPAGEPPTRGPHFSIPEEVGVYRQPVQDGNAIHSLEHGIVWLSYNPELVSDEVVQKLETLGRRYDRDTIVSPRPTNRDAIDIVSWGQILRLDVFDGSQLEAFIQTNRNRAPEPFVRTNRSM